MMETARASQSPIACGRLPVAVVSADVHMFSARRDLPERELFCVSVRPFWRCSDGALLLAVFLAHTRPSERVTVTH